MLKAGSARIGAALLVLIAVPCLLHLPELSGLISCNPIYATSGLHPFPYPSLTGGACFIDGNAGGTVQALGGLSAQLWIDGKLPWWNHFSGAGLPLASEMQPASFFLPFVLLLHSFDGPLYLKLLLQVLAGIFTFLFLREIELSLFAALLGGILFALNATFTWFSDAPIMPVAFLPLLMFGIQRCRRLSLAGLRGGQASVALAIALSVLAGHPETAFVDGVLGLLWAMLAVFELPAKYRLSCASRIMAGGLCGLLLSTPALLPFLHDLRASTVAFHVLAQASRVDADQAASLLFPAIFGPPYSDGAFQAWASPWGYLAPSLALLALLGLMQRCWTSRRRLLCGWFLFCLGGAFQWPIFGLLRSILPAFDQVDFGRYVGASAEFAAIVLACLVLDRWRRGHAPERLRLALLGQGAIAVVVLFISRHRLALTLHDAPPGPLLLGLSLLGAATFLGLLAGALAGPPTGRAPILIGAVVTLESLLLALPPILAGTTDFRLEQGPVSYLKQHLGLGRIYAMGGALQANYGALFGVAMVNDLYLPLPHAWEAYVQRLSSLESPVAFIGTAGDPRTRLSDFQAHRASFIEAGVSFVLLPVLFDPIAGRRDFVPVLDDGVTRLYRLPEARPYFETTGGPCRLTPSSRDEVYAECDAPATLLRREMMFDGWRVRLNGVHAKTAVQSGFFQSVGLPAGGTDVVWTYRPPNSRLIVLLFVLGTTGLAFCVLQVARPVRRVLEHAADRC